MIDLLGALMIAAGLALVILGGWFLWRTRAARPHPPASAPADGRAAPPLSQMSAPTRYSIGIVLLAVGYHLIVWALPPSWGSPLAFPRDRWPILLSIAAGWVIISLLMDRLDRSRAG